jgi:NDP-sugar pyrophosphorylase family protein
MVPFLGRPLIDYLLDSFVENGLHDVVLTSAHSSFVNHLSQTERDTLRVRYEEPQGQWRGSANCVRDLVRALGDSISDPYIVVYGDSLLRADLAGMVAFHLEREADITILYHRPDFAAFLYQPTEGPMPEEPRTNYGVMDCGNDALVTLFIEKPTLREIPQRFHDPLANAAAYVIGREVLSQLCEPDIGDFGYDLFPKLVNRGMCVQAFSIGTGYREDVGTLDRYFHLHMLALEGGIEIPHLGSTDGRRVWIATDASISPNATLVAPAVIGCRSSVAPGARLERCYLGDDVRIGNGATVLSSVIHSHVAVGAGAQVRSSVLASHATVGNGITVPAGTVVGPYAVFGDPRLSNPGGENGQART